MLKKKFKNITYILNIVKDILLKMDCAPEDPFANYQL